nr:putative reverse transcriptase domain-containing protein [Tanacetum cinerariifolium]
MQESKDPQVVVYAVKLPIFNPNEFDLWKMRIEQYSLMTDYSLWEVILNGDSPIPTKVIDGLESVEARLVVYQKNETVFEEDIKLDVMLRDNALVKLRKKFEKAEQERDDDAFISSESDVSMPPSPVHDRYQSGEGYHVVPPPYTGTFMPLKLDLVFYDAAIANETVPTVFNVELNYDYYEKKMIQKPVRNHVMRGNHQHYARMTHPNPYRHVVPIAVLTRSRLVSLTAVRPDTTVVPHINVTRPRPAKTIVNKPHSPLRRPINHIPSPKLERIKPLRVRALVMTIGLDLPKQILEAQIEALKPENLEKEDVGVMPLEGIHVDGRLQFVEEPVEIMEREIKRLNQSRIPLVKVRWNSRRGLEFTWEREYSFRKKYPHLFTNQVSSSIARS